MHMADALISPAVGGAMWAASAGLLAYSARQVRSASGEKVVPLMGVLGAFVFAAQMINFAIPGTGSSGHLGGGLLLSILLGPHAALLVLASVLTVQAFFFADGGLLALGCNIFNLGVLPAFVAYPLVYLPIARDGSSPVRRWVAAIVASVVGLQLGSLGVVTQTILSGVTGLSFAQFAAVMQSIHLPIGLVEGAATAALVAFLARVRPATLSDSAGARPPSLVVVAVATLLVSGVLSWFASGHPDGLEWSVSRAESAPVAEAGQGIAAGLAGVQERTSVFPDYGFRDERDGGGRLGTSVSGLVGATLTLAAVVLIGLCLRARSVVASGP